MKNKVKGFTLIELIVVMAIFTIILASAMQLLGPMSKLMTQAEVTENGSAYTSNIAAQLENEFGSVEHIDCYNTNTDMYDRVLKFAEYYYEGILRAGSTSAAPRYGTGTIHVLVINNSNAATFDGTTQPAAPSLNAPWRNAVIEKYEYTADFTTGNVTVNFVTPSSTADTEMINRAAYDDYNFEIKLGTYDESNWEEVPSMTDLGASATTAGLAFSIKAMTNSQKNGSYYDVYGNASTALVNVANHSMRYYGLNEALDSGSSDPDAPHVFTIAPIRSVSNQEANADMTGSRKYNMLFDMRNDFATTSNRIDNYMFIYSYGAEIDIS